MKELYCFASPEEMFTDMKKTGEAIEVLLDLAEDFDRRFQEKKETEIWWILMTWSIRL